MKWFFATACFCTAVPSSLGQADLTDQMIQNLQKGQAYTDQTQSPRATSDSGGAGVDAEVEAESWAYYFGQQRGSYTPTPIEERDVVSGETAGMSKRSLEPLDRGTIAAPRKVYQSTKRYRRGLWRAHPNEAIDWTHVVDLEEMKRKQQRKRAAEEAAQAQDENADQTESTESN